MIRGTISFSILHSPFSIRYAPVFPFDWDGDGLENSVDPEPLVAGPDAHGTNVEWYNIVCSNVFAATEGADGIELAPRHAGVNTNAYYFVDVVAERGPAPIYFTADGPSRLGSPVVVAQAGATNHVPLLIGASYDVVSPVPLQIVSAPTSVLSQLGGGNAEGRLSIFWPSGGTYDCVDGVYVPDAAEQERLHGVFSWSGGCCLRLRGETMELDCSSCGCGGCSTVLSHAFEGYVVRMQGPGCGCSDGQGDTAGISSVATVDGASVALGFDKEYLLLSATNRCEQLPLRSTRTSLSLSVNGGLHGGTLNLDTDNLGNLSLVGGALPSAGPITVAPQETYSVSVTYEGKRASENARDILVSATFTENGTNTRVRRNAHLTVVSLSVGGIRFNHTPSASTNDAVNIRINANTTPDPLTGEWSDEGRVNHPACYTAGMQAVVQVQFTTRPQGFVTSASLSAESSEGALGDMASRQIAFAQGKSDWVDWPLQRTILSAVDMFDQKWSWRVSDVNGSSSGSFNMASTGPHRIYVILDNPVYPWRTSAGHISLVRTNVLELACTVAHGLSSEQDILSSLTRYLFANMGYGYSGTSYLSTDLQFYLTTYLERLLTTANCYDQANALKSCAAAMGIRTETYEMEPFGYLNPMHIVGVEGMCNNPGAVGMDVLRPVNDTSRAWFRRHAFVIYGNDLVYDACLGPFCGAALSDYLSQCIDCSTDAERDVGYYSTIPGVGGRSPVSYRVISTQ